MAGLNQLVGGHFDAQIDHLVAVVGEDDLDQVLADVVDVALHRGQEHLAPRLGFGALHELLQVAHRGLHGFGGLQHFRHNQLIVVEQPADFGHARHQRPVDDVERRVALGALAVQIGNQAILAAFDDVVGQTSIERQVRAVLLAFFGLAEVLGDGRDVELVERRLFLRALLPPILRRRAQQFVFRIHRRRVEQQVLRQPPLLFRDGCKALQLLGVDDRQVQPRLGAVIEEDRIHHFARLRGKAERNVGNAEDGLRVRQALLHQPDAFDGLDGAADVIDVAGRAGEHQRIEDDILRRYAILLGQQLVGSLRYGQFALARKGLRLLLVFVDGAHHHRGAIFSG